MLINKGSSNRHFDSCRGNTQTKKSNKQNLCKTHRKTDRRNRLKKSIPLVLFHLSLRVDFFYELEQVMERDKFMSAEEAVKFGLIDKILTHPESDEKNK
jgi:hypothetical protein